MMVLPILLGYWLDLYLGTVPLFAVIGLVLGMSTGIWQLIKLVNQQSPSSAPDANDRAAGLPETDDRDQGTES